MDLRDLCPDSLRLACALAGCDYFAGIPGIGMKRAVELAVACKLRYEEGDLSSYLEGVLSDSDTKRYPSRLDASIDDIQRATMVFKHQTVYNPRDMRLQPLNQVIGNTLGRVDQFIVGELYPDEEATEVYSGSRHPASMYPFHTPELLGNTPIVGTRPELIQMSSERFINSNSIL
jgi:exonuclease-1